MFVMRLYVATVDSKGSWEETIFHCVCIAAVGLDGYFFFI